MFAQFHFLKINFQTFIKTKCTMGMKSIKKIQLFYIFLVFFCEVIDFLKKVILFLAKSVLVKNTHIGKSSCSIWMVFFFLFILFDAWHHYIFSDTNKNFTFFSSLIGCLFQSFKRTSTLFSYKKCVVQQNNCSNT